MSNSSPTVAGFTRTESRERSHAQLLRQAFLYAGAAHLLFALAINPGFILRLLRPDVMIGYPGEPRRGELAPQGPQGKDKFTYFRVRRYTGPVTLTSYEPVGTRPADAATSPTKGLPVAGNLGKSGPLESKVAGRSGGTGGPLVIELGEDFAVLKETGSLAQSEKFQALKIVRPDYPRSAVARGIEGLVRLRVEVDVSGSVLEVDAIENTSQDSTLVQAAIEAMFHWKFKPYRVKSEFVPFTLIVPFRYRLID